MRIGILGGGLVGLVVAAKCKRHSCEVLELDRAVGGNCRSLVRDGYTFDLGGPHIMFSRNKEILAEMYAKLGDNLARRRRRNAIWYAGTLVKYPFENGLFDLPPLERFECLYHYIHNDAPPPTNFKAWIYHTFGKGIAEKYMIPYNEKIWNVPADQMTFDWVEGRVPRPPLEDVIKSAVGVETEGYAHQLDFGYPKTGGIEALPKAYAADCREIALGFRVSRIWKEDGAWHVGDGASVKRYDRLVSTIPIQDLIAALPAVPGEVGAAVGRLRFNSLSLVMLGVEGSAGPDLTALYVPDPSLPFHRLSFPRSFTDEGAPPDHFAVAAEITTNPGDGFHEMTDARLIEEVVAGLESMKLIERERVAFRAVHRTKHAYVVRTFDYSANLAPALAYVKSLGIASVGRNAEFEYINMDEAVRRGSEVALALDGEAAAP